MTFKEDKIKTLKELNKGKDKSKKGSIDKDIIPLITTINSLPNYYTTSSCSGRIIAYSKAKKKNEVKWIFVTHEKTNTTKFLKQLINLPKEDLFLKQESFILHIVAKDLNSAEELLKKARNIGLKKSGIQTIKNKINIEIFYQLGFETIIAKKSKLIINKDYIEELINLGNKNLEKNKEKIKAFKASFSTI